MANQINKRFISIEEAAAIVAKGGDVNMLKINKDWSLSIFTTMREWLRNMAFIVDVPDADPKEEPEEEPKEEPKKEAAEEPPMPEKKTRSSRLKLDEEKVIALYEAGTPLTEIGKIMDCSWAPIKRILKPLYGDENGNLRRGNGRPALDRGKIMALHNAGWSPMKIADEMGCKTETIKEILKELKEAKAADEVSES